MTVYRYHCNCGATSDPFTTPEERDMMRGIHDKFCTKPAPAPNSVEGQAIAARAPMFGVRRRRVV